MTRRPPRVGGLLPQVQCGLGDPGVHHPAGRHHGGGNSTDKCFSDDIFPTSTNYFAADELFRRSRRVRAQPDKSVLVTHASSGTRPDRNCPQRLGRHLQPRHLSSHHGGLLEGLDSMVHRQEDFRIYSSLRSIHSIITYIISGPHWVK